MLAYFLSTCTTGRRLLLVWLFAALGLAATAAGLGLAILALGPDPAGNRQLVQETIHGTAALACLWLLARCLEGDARSGFCLAADQTRGGAAARQYGRWGGAVVVGCVAALPALAAGVAWTDGSAMCLLSTCMSSTCLLAAWGLLLGLCGLSGVLLLLAGGALWLAGHLPWGAPGWGGAAGQWLGAWLPPGLAASGGVAPAAPIATVGLLLLAGARVGGGSRPAARRAAP